MGSNTVDVLEEVLAVGRPSCAAHVVLSVVHDGRPDDDSQLAPDEVASPHGASEASGTSGAESNRTPNGSAE